MAGRKWIKKRKILLSIIVLSVIWAIIAPKCGEVKYYAQRVNSLKVWCYRTREYQQQTGFLPHGLYEIYIYNKKNGEDESLPILLNGQLDASEMEELRDNPSLFVKIVQYEFVQDPNQWYVQEKSPGMYGFIYKINQLGEIQMINCDDRSANK